MPGLTIATESVSPRSTALPSTVPQSESRSRSSSPNRPPISPITPTLPTARLASAPTSDPIPPFAAQRQTFTHSQPNQVGIAPPRPEPIDFDSNPDVLALKSAISILQLQRQKATADIQALSAAKNEATGDPDAFLSDLRAGRVRTQGDKLIPSDDEDEDEDHVDGAGRDKPGKMETDDKTEVGSKTRAWSSLPKPLNVVRCPPINWSQYGVVGDSLDKLHADQRARPSQGTPAVIGSGGTFEFKGEPRPGDQKEFVGVAAPYTPGKDKLDKKPKGGKR